MRAFTSLSEFATHKSICTCGHATTGQRVLFRVDSGKAPPVVFSAMIPREQVYRMHNLLAEVIMNLEVLPSLVMSALIGK